MDEEAGAGISGHNSGFSEAMQAAFAHAGYTKPSEAVTEYARAIERKTTLDLLSARPDLSAASGMTNWQYAIIFTSILAIIVFVWFFPVQTVLVLNIIAALFFAALIFIRLAAFFLRKKTRDDTKPPARRSYDMELPVYSVLVPLFRESSVISQLVGALEKIDYPGAKLDIKLIFEEEDTKTLKIARSMALPVHFECIVVPGGMPQTKPRALDFALARVRGEFITIYDAEDIPDPGQLRRALCAFDEGGENLACVQAHLGFYNSEDNWLTRQFALEYAALFEVFLPMLAAYRFPMLLGGTSNHFRTSLLKDIGGWDPFNVTEDADIGIRLARFGYICGVIPSRTLEEASSDLGNWMRQRSRWLKGWMQTYVVHMRNPFNLWRELGPAGFFVFQALAGGMIVSALVYPLFLGLLIAVLMQGHLLDSFGGIAGSILLGLNGFNFVTGYAAAALLGAEGSLRIKKPHLAKSVFLIPFYWLLISACAYMALWQFFTKPFYWEKTDHGLSLNMPDAFPQNENTMK